MRRSGCVKRCGVCAAALLCVLLSLSGCQKESREESRLTGISALDAGNYETAIVSFDQALERSGGRVGAFELDVLKYRAEAEYLLGDYEASAHTYDVLIQVDQELPEYLNGRCMSYASLGEVEAALADYTRSLSLDPESAGLETAMLALTGAMEETGGYESQVTEIYRQVIDSGKAGAQLYNRMGVSLLKGGEVSQALDCFARGIAMADETAMPDLLYNQAVAYEYQGDFVGAKALFEQYVERYGTDDRIQKELTFLETR